MTTEEPILVDRHEARTIVGVTSSTFDRLLREGQFANMTMAGGRPLYRVAELHAYRAAHCLGRSENSVTITSERPSKSAGLKATRLENLPAGAMKRRRGYFCHPQPREAAPAADLRTS